MRRELWPVAILPWLELRDKVSVGKVVFWPYHKMKDEMLPVSYPGEALDKYAAVFRRSSKDPAPVSVLSYPGQSDVPLSRAQAREVQRARYALFASVFMWGLREPELADVYSMLPSAEHFTMCPLPGPAGVDRGFWVQHYPRRLIAGTIGEAYEVRAPEHLHSMTYGVTVFEPLRHALEAALGRKESERVWRSVEWFFYANTSHEHFTEEARLVMLCMAIEAALEAKTRGRWEFVGGVAEATKHLKLPRGWHRVVLNEKGKSKPLLWSPLQRWAWDFYEARSGLVHSGKRRGYVPAWCGKRPNVSHWFIGSYVWFECLWKALCDAGIVPPRPLEGGTSNSEILASAKAYGRWVFAWHAGTGDMRKWWRSFLTGRLRQKAG